METVSHCNKISIAEGHTFKRLEYWLTVSINLITLILNSHMVRATPSIVVTTNTLVKTFITIVLSNS